MQKVTDWVKKYPKLYWANRLTFRVVALQNELSKTNAFSCSRLKTTCLAPWADVTQNTCPDERLLRSDSRSDSHVDSSWQNLYKSVAVKHLHRKKMWKSKGASSVQETSSSPQILTPLFPPKRNTDTWARFRYHATPRVRRTAQTNFGGPVNTNCLQQVSPLGIHFGVRRLLMFC